MALFSTIVIREYNLIFFFEKKRYRSFVYIIFCLWQFLSMQTIYVVPKELRLIISVLTVGLVASIFDGKVRTKIVLSCIYIALWMLCEVLTGCIYLGIINVAEYHEIVCSVFSKGCLYCIIKLFKHFFTVI